MNSIEQQRTTFEKRAETYFEKRSTPNHQYLKNLMWQYFFKDKDYLSKPSMRILEPMCGYGDGKQILQRHLKHPFCYSAFDYSETLVRKAKEHDPSLDIWVMDVTKFNEKEAYDLIIIIGSLHHVPDYCQQVVSNIYAALKPSGYFINFEPTQNNWFFRKVRQRIYHKNKTFDEQTERAFDLLELNRIFTGAGFIIKDQAYQGLSSFVLYYNPNAFPFLNIGGQKLVKFFFSLDRLFFKNLVGKKLSFSTTTLLQKKTDTHD